MPTDRAPAPTASSHRPRRGKKYFTVAEANRALAYIGRIVEDISVCYRRTLVLRDRLEHPQPEDALEELRGDYEKSMDQLSTLVEELRQVGVELKDFEKGLIDFPARHQDREVFLCWHRGEAEVAFWHETDTGFTGRQPIALLSSK